MAEFVYNNSVHASTGFSPFFANFGFHSRFDMHNSSSIPNPSVTSYIEILVQTHSTLKKNLQKARESMKFYADRKRLHPPHFTPGDQVWLKTAVINLKKTLFETN